MKTKIKIETEVDIKTLIVKAGVRYWEDAEINGEYDTENGDNIPCKDGNFWCPIIDIDTGIITNWIKGTTAKICYKICDDGRYFIKDKNGNVVLSIIDDYVPEILCPKEAGYGDYIIMDIDENGQIADWNPTIEGFE